MRAVVALSLLAAACGFEHGSLSAVRDDAPRGDASDGGGGSADAMIDGSPDVDTDGDGHNDAVDNCFTIANANQRDWDQDGRGDVCDGCPHIALALEGADGDADGLPDACDPRPAQAGDSRLIWLGFYDSGDIAGWTTNGGTWNVTGGALAQTSTNRAILLSPVQYQRVYVSTRIQLASLPSSSTVGACSGRTPTNSAYDCCDLIVNGSGTPQVEAASTSAGQIRSSWAGSVAAGALVDIAHDTASSVNNDCAFRQAAITKTQSCGKDGTNGHVIMWTDGATAAFRYLFVVQIGP